MATTLRWPSQELVVGGYRTAGDGRFKALLAGVHDHDRLVYAGAAKTDFDARAVDQVMPRLRSLTAVRTPLAGDQPEGDPDDTIHFVKLRLVMQAEIAERTSARRVRQTSSRGLREDGPAREARRER